MVATPIDNATIRGSASPGESRHLSRRGALRALPQHQTLDVHGHEYPASRSHATGSRPRVLVVDDEPYIVDLLAYLLEEEGFVVDRAFDGQQAWLIAERTPPDLVITDISMPRLDGLELLERFRGVRALAATPVILMSAARCPVESARTTFLPKPFDLDQMLSLVETELAAS